MGASPDTSATTSATMPGQQGSGPSRTTPDSPVDDHTYNVLQALTSKLEAIEAYEMYRDDDASGLFEELLADERRHADRLLDGLRGLMRA
jgi:hypothetical protein